MSRLNDLAPVTYKWGNDEVQGVYLIPHQNPVIIDKTGKARETTIDQLSLGNSRLRDYLQTKQVDVDHSSYRTILKNAVETMKLF